MNMIDFDNIDLTKIDEQLYDFLISNNENMPGRFVKFLAYYYPDARIRKVYLSKLGVLVGENSFINLGFQCTLAKEGISAIIGKNVSIGPNVTFVVSSCANNGQEINTIPYIRDHLTKESQIIVEDEAWIGAGVVVLPGITIGRCSVVGAGSVVIRNVEPFSIYAGVPAKKIRTLETANQTEV
jgi:maltose O-acetyltransferase